MKKKLNIGIIGKNFGYNVIYKSIEKNKSFNVVGFSQKNKKLNQEIPKNVKIYSNWKNLILDKKIKAVVIATPPNLHNKIIKYAKFFNIELSLSLTFETITSNKTVDERVRDLFNKINDVSH
jgi:hypothetical protein